MSTREPPADRPLFPEPVLGWRVWRLERPNGSLRLVSVTRSDRWPPRRAMQATCAASHPTPEERCTCGLYAASSPEDLARSGIVGPATSVVGAIAMWGTVVEHARGARSQFAYPVRLRLVCGRCLTDGAGAVEASTVAGGAGALQAGCRRHPPSGQPLRPAAEIQAELLSTYAVDLLPLERVGRSLRHGGGPAVPTPVSVLQFVFTAMLALLRFAIGAFMTLMLLGWALVIAGAVIGGIAHVFVGNAATSAATSYNATSAPSPSALDALPPIGRRTFEPHRRIPPTPAPRVPDIALVCGVQHGRAIELMTIERCPPLESSLLGFAERTAPKGARHDCVKGWDAYSRGARFWVCWDALPPHGFVRPWATSPNPFITPRNEGGALHGDR